MKRLVSYLIPLALLVCFTSFYIAAPVAVESLQQLFFDSLQRLSPRPYLDAPVRVIDLDEASLEKYGQWPWPRPRLARLIDRLKEEGASVIAFDVLFAEPDQTSPSRMIPFWEELGGGNLPPSPEGLPDHDEILARAFSEAGVISAFVLTGEPQKTQPALKTGFAHAGPPPSDFLPAFPGAVKTLDVLEKAAAGNGAINFLPSYDPVIRRIPLIFKLQSQVYPSLSAEALRVHSGASAILAKTDASGILSLKIGPHVIPADEHGRMWLYDSGPVEKRTIPAWKVLDAGIEPGSLEGKIVYIGTSAAGLKDLRSTPLNPAAPGVEVHAQLTEQIFNRQFLHRPEWVTAAELLFLAALGLFLILLMPLLGAAWAAVLTLVCLAGFYGISFYAFFKYRWLVDPLIPSAGCLLIYLSSSLLHFLKTEREKKHIRSAFSRYLSPSLVEQLAGEPARLKLGGEIRDMTVLFADIRGFTSLAEKMPPADLTRFMNDFLTPMTAIIQQEEGTIDKYMGDCIMAFWNAPLEVKDHVSRACRAALLMKSKAETLAGPEKLRLGIGINTGSCCVGNMGSEQRFDYSVLGDAVNLASRLESLCRVYGVDILLGEDTFRRISDCSCLEIDQVRVKGKEQAVKIYTLLGDETIRHHQLFQRLKVRHEEMLVEYRRKNWQAALKAAEECRKMQVPGMNLGEYYSLFAAKIKNLIQNPPAPEWDGTTILSVK